MSYFSHFLFPVWIQEWLFLFSLATWGRDNGNFPLYSRSNSHHRAIRNRGTMVTVTVISRIKEWFQKPLSWLSSCSSEQGSHPSFYLGIYPRISSCLEEQRSQNTANILWQQRSSSTGIGLAVVLLLMQGNRNKIPSAYPTLEAKRHIKCSIWESIYPECKHSWGSHLTPP